ncbi:MAG: DNA polymerase III subunit gamma and tau [Nocardioidaceae bacterium]
MEEPLALYRRYRPQSFGEVIGQEHVTEPLRAALRNGRVNHAYLFSGPRGCGKTTSARILARALNCEQGPTDEPCGECPSCVDLGRGGSGSIDVIEMDAASHGGVDASRDLREKAMFAPVSSRFKVYIIDEAHMVTTAGFNALLKVVEEPPPHVKFIFATTEPDKVIGTIRSRTHHYPFRLIPPRLMSEYVADLCARESVQIEPAALPLVVRAGAGSARDTLSVLDQLIGGSEADQVTYALAAGLLGFTPDSLLDDVVDALAAHDGASAFGAINTVIESGQDPRRFTEDLLRRLRDLVIVAAVPEATSSGLIDVPADLAERLKGQAQRFGQAELSRAADIVAAGLVELKGSTAPRLMLELIVARVLLPGADDSASGFHARLDRIERRLSIGDPVAVPQQAAPVQQTPARQAPPTQAPPTQAPPAQATPPQPAPVEPRPVEPPASAAPEPESDPTSGPGVRAAEEPPFEPEPEPESAAPTAAAAPSLGLVDLRRLWPEVLEATKGHRRMTWILLSQHAQVVAVDATTLTVGFNNPHALQSFTSGGNDEILRRVIIDKIGPAYRIDAIVDPAAEPGAVPTRVTRPAVPDVPATAPAAHQPDNRGAGLGRPVVEPAPAPADDAPPAWVGEPDDAVDRDDPDADDAGMTHTELIERELGGSVIEETIHE